MYIIYDLIYILPELFILAFSLLLLLLGAFAGERVAKTIQLLSIFTVLLSIYALAKYVPKDTVFIFNNALSSSRLIVYSKLLLLVACLFFLIMNSGSETKKHSVINFYEFPVVILLSLIGMMFMISANDFISLFLSMELQSLSLYILAAIDRNNSKSAEAGVKYFTLGALGTGLFLFGASYIYGLTGTINFSEIANYFHEYQHLLLTNKLFLVLGIVMIICALCFKVAAAPFHMWAPDVYQGAPMIVTAFFATLPKIAATLMFAFLLYYKFALVSWAWEQIILVVGCLSMLVGAIAAIKQTNLKRLLAYSSIGHVGFILLAFLHSDSGLISLFQYVVIYLSMNLGFFACLLALKKDNKQLENIKDLANLYEQAPVMSLLMSCLLFSLAGIPPFAGFFAKFYILKSLIVDHSLYLVALIAVISSVISAYYYLKIIKTMYFSEGKMVARVVLTPELSFVALIFTLFNSFYFVDSDCLQSLMIFITQ